MDHVDWNTAGLVAVAIINLYVAHMARKTEKNTNSMKDELVKSTAKASYSAGVKHGEDNPREPPNATPG